jgi:hypothetical protein
MKLTLTPSTGTTIVVWRDNETYCARRAGEASEPEVCLPVDLFEVIAELAGLDLEQQPQAAEAVRLAAEVDQRLHSTVDGDGGSAQSRRRSS